MPRPDVSTSGVIAVEVGSWGITENRRGGGFGGGGGGGFRAGEVTLGGSRPEDARIKLETLYTVFEYPILSDFRLPRNFLSKHSCEQPSCTFDTISWLQEQLSFFAGRRQ